ncbi:MAG: iron-containing alcohol dehydrogenase [Limnochordia bacterium]|nr:iron-containing alcohol dehydrogenase [Limnochordia bacterium]MDD4518221.1 iron-containing alcohol dehydrogenase [Limnochordia bacterium]
MECKQKEARGLLKQFKGDNYAFGIGALDQVGVYARQLGRRVLVIANDSKWLQPTVKRILNLLEEEGCVVCGCVQGALPNAPKEDVYRLEGQILHANPDCLVAIGGGSTIDAVKAANTLACLGTHSGDIEDYFGTGLVTEVSQKLGKNLLPMVAVQTAASSGAHLTKYSNITDPMQGQKKLIVDDAVVPARAVFDYGLTVTTPYETTLDGAFDGLAHCLEVFFGAPEAKYDQIAEIALLGIELVTDAVTSVAKDQANKKARESLGLATDLGAYAIMVGGTNGAHLTSFSLVDVTSHGRACAIMNPYYTVFFAPSIEKQLRAVGEVLQQAGLITDELDGLTGRELGIAVASGLVGLSKRVGFPTTLADLPGFSDEHIARALTAAKDPKLEMKLKNMPVSLSAGLVDEYMGPILQAAKSGDFALIKNL